MREGAWLGSLGQGGVVLKVRGVALKCLPSLPPRCLLEGCVSLSVSTCRTIDAVSGEMLLKNKTILKFEEKLKLNKPEFTFLSNIYMIFLNLMPEVAQWNKNTLH